MFPQVYMFFIIIMYIVVAVYITEHCDYFSDDSDGADVDNVVSYEASPESPFDSNSGPYCSLLRDFTLRSYMSGGQRSKFFHYCEHYLKIVP